MLIILEILKIIGIVLLVLIGLLLLILCLVLFVPIRYHLKGTIQGKNIDAYAEAGWLFKALYLKVNYRSGDEPAGFLRFLWIKLFEGSLNAKEDVSVTAENREMDSSALTPERTEESCGTSSEVASSLQKENFTENKPQEMKEEVRAEISKAETPKEKKEKNSIQKAIESASKFLQDLFVKIKGAVEGITASTETLKEKIREMKDFFEEKENQKLLKELLKEIKRVLHQLLPRKGKGNLEFGLGDPYLTGLALEVLAFLYPVYADILYVCPTFEEKKVNADLDAKGRIYLAVVAYSIVKIYYGKEFRNMYLRFKRIIQNEQ